MDMPACSKKKVAWLAMRLPEKMSVGQEICIVAFFFTCKVLGGVGQAGDEGAAKVGAFDEVEKGGVAADLGFDFDGSLDHGELLDGVGHAFAAETFEGAEGFLLAAFADEPPWGLWGEEDEDEEGGLKEVSSEPFCVRDSFILGRSTAKPMAHAKPTGWSTGW